MLFGKRHETLNAVLASLPDIDTIPSSEASKRFQKELKAIHDHLHHEQKKLEPSLVQIQEHIEGYVKELERAIRTLGEGHPQDSKINISLALEHLTQAEVLMKVFAESAKKDLE
jgi:hypothetical protein